MRVLVTGATGFVGKSLLAELMRAGHSVVATSLHAETLSIDGKTIAAMACDVTSFDQLRQTLRTAKPDAIAHLAGMAHVVDAAKDRSALIESSVIAAHLLCRAVNQECEKPLPILFTSSAMVYGAASGADEAINENSTLNPDTPYSASKLATEYVLRTYNGTKVRPYIVRPFNHTGPGQSEAFVCPALARRILAAADRSKIPVGNLDALRDISDVRDIVRAYRLILEKQPEQDLFVLGSGRTVAIREVLNELIRISDKHVVPEVDPTLLRGQEVGRRVADIRRAEASLSWRPEYTLSTTLRDLYTSMAP